MSKTVKCIDPAALASLTTGVLLVDFSTVHEAAEWVMSRPIWTHQFPSMFDEIKSAVLLRFPNMPIEIPSSGWERCRDDIRDHYGLTVNVVGNKGEE